MSTSLMLFALMTTTASQLPPMGVGWDCCEANRYLPGDAYFHFRITQGDLARWDGQKDIEVSYWTPSRNDIFLARLGFGRLMLIAAEPWIADGLKNFYADVRPGGPGLLERSFHDEKEILTELDGPHALVYAADFPWKEALIGLRFNDAWRKPPWRSPWPFDGEHRMRYQSLHSGGPLYLVEDWRGVGTYPVPDFGFPQNFAWADSSPELDEATGQIDASKVQLFLFDDRSFRSYCAASEGIPDQQSLTVLTQSGRTNWTSHKDELAWLPEGQDLEPAD